MPRQTHTCVDRAVVPNTWTLRLLFLFGLYENFAPPLRLKDKLYFYHFYILLCEIFLSPTGYRDVENLQTRAGKSLADS